MHDIWLIALLVSAIISIVIPAPSAIAVLVPVAASTVAIASSLISVSAARISIAPLWAPLAFVVFAVPLAVMLERYGFFEELATILTRDHHRYGALWVMAALVVAGLNLDAAVVLLSPLYLNIARKRQFPPFALCIQPALLSGLASSALPISNVTNLIADARLHLDTFGFVEHLGVPTLVAVVVGWLFYRINFAKFASMKVPDDGVWPSSKSEKKRPAALTLAVGGTFCILVVAGFILAPSFQASPWQVAAGADVVLMILTGSLPWREVPVRIVAMVICIAVLADAVGKTLPIHRIIGGSSPLDIARVSFASAAVSNIANNLPTVLVALTRLATHPTWSAWAVLLGANAGAILLPSGSLAVLLWIATMRRLGFEVRERHYIAVAWSVALPALLAGTASLLVLRLILGGAG